MIELQNYTPEVYYKESRDFQFIGRLYDIVLNYIKTNSEAIYNLQINDNTDEQLLDLVAATLGFKAKHNYSTKQLHAICSVFTELLKYKGTKKAITLLIQTILNSEGMLVEGESESEIASSLFEVEGNNLILYIPNTLRDINLLRDVLTYILPAGMTCNIVQLLQDTKEVNQELFVSDKVYFYPETPTDPNSNRDQNKPAIMTNTTVIQLKTSQLPEDSKAAKVLTKDSDTSVVYKTNEGEN